ncbi:MAG: cytochrome-c peroxidase, partial [Candidatus Binataceae bacterium]
MRLKAIRTLWIVGIVAVAAGIAARSVSIADDHPPRVGISPDAQKEITDLETRIDKYEAFYLKQLDASPTGLVDQYSKETTLGALLLYDKHLSVNDNEACAFCHMPETGFTGPVSALNQTTGSYPGSVRFRFGNRKPQSYAYAPSAPILHYDTTQKNFYGGNFWDGRATGTRLDSPTAEQAQGPPDNPVEMGFSDFACFVYRVSRSPYSHLTEEVWGNQIFAISWPADTETVCSKPGAAYDPRNPAVHLGEIDRGRAQAAYDELTEAIAQYEAHPPVSRFSSKFDYYLAGDKRVKLMKGELLGWTLFRTTGNCNSCHLDGTQNNGPTPRPKKGRHVTATNLESLFTDFTFANLGVPRNSGLPYLYETSPDQYGYTINSAGLNYRD